MIKAATSPTDVDTSVPVVFTAEQCSSIKAAYYDAIVDALGKTVAAQTAFALSGRSSESCRAHRVAQVLSHLISCVSSTDDRDLNGLTESLARFVQKDAPAGPTHNISIRESALRDTVAEYLELSDEGSTNLALPPPVAVFFAELFPEDIENTIHIQLLSEYATKCWEQRAGTKARNFLSQKPPNYSQAAEALIRGFLRHETFAVGRDKQFLNAERTTRHRKASK